MESLVLSNGVRMPALGFGTWTLRGDAGRACVRAALETGYRLLDTAQMYENEEMVGEAVRDSGIPREEMFLTTKLSGASAGYREAKEGIRRSLRALGTDYIDLLLIHEPYAQAPAMYRAMEEACRAGLVRAIGISNFNGQDYARFIQDCSILPAVNQVESHVYYPRLELCRQLAACGTRMQSWSPFTQGRRPIFEEPALRQAGAAHGKTAAQAALRYLLQHGIAVIPKTAHRARMEENFALFDFALTPAEMARIDALNGSASLFGWP